MLRDEVVISEIDKFSVSVRNAYPFILRGFKEQQER